MFGKHFESMYSGSMVGSGALVFAVMGYVIANQKPDREFGSQVELNPTLLAAILGEEKKDVEKAIEYLCKPDPESRSKEHDGKRLIRLAQFSYQVVTGAKYRKIRDAETRREQGREATRKWREKLKQESVATEDARDFENSGKPDALDVEIARPAPKFKKWWKKMPMEEVMRKLKEGGMPTNTHDMAVKLRTIHGLEEGEDGGEDGLTPEERIREVQERIRLEEEIEAEVRKQFNPDCDSKKARMAGPESERERLKRKADAEGGLDASP